MKKILYVTTVCMAIALSILLIGCGGKPAESGKEPLRCGYLDADETHMQFKDSQTENKSQAQSISKMKQAYAYEITGYKSLNTLLLDLNAGKLDYIMVPSVVGTYLAKQDDSITIYDDGLDSVRELRMAVREEDKDLYDLLQKGIADLQADGTLDELIANYVTELSGESVEKEIVGNPDGETYVVGITGDFPPIDYVAADGNAVGFNVALMSAIAQKEGVNFTFEQVEMDARLAALSSKRIDVIFWFANMQAENYVPQKEGLLLTDPYFLDGGAYATKGYDMNKVLELYRTAQK